jgi:hemolysin type calcium-binding protein
MNARRTTTSAALGCLALVVTATVGAATINGTAGNNTLRGGTQADQINGRGGNDKLYGAGGNDTLAGGPGNDLLVGGPGADKLTCGAGKDIARGDARDKIAKDCERVTGLPAPTPPAPPAPAPPPPPPPVPTVAPVTAGSYKGQTQNGNFVFFTVTSNRAITAFRVNDLPDPCEPGGTLSGGEDFGGSSFPIAADGTFLAEGRWDGSDVSGDFELTHWDGKLAGAFGTATSVTGTVLMNYEFNYQGTHFRCSSGTVAWSASLQT